MGGAPPIKSVDFIDYLQVLYRVCILSFGVCSVFEFLACEEMNGTTNLAVVDLSPCGFVFKEFWLQALILIEFLSFLFFVYFATKRFAHSSHRFAQPGFYGGYPKVL